MDWKIYAFLYWVNLILTFVYLRKLIKENLWGKPSIGYLVVLLYPLSFVFIIMVYYDLRDAPNPLQNFLNKLFGYKDKQN